MASPTAWSRASRIGLPGTAVLQVMGPAASVGDELESYNYLKEKALLVPGPYYTGVVL